MTKNLYFRRARPVQPGTRPSILLGETSRSFPLSEVLRDILQPHYWLESNGNPDGSGDEITLNTDADKTYLKGLCDGGTPGACLLLGLIEADGGVVIWIGE